MPALTAGSEPCRILIVDDDAGIRSLLSAVLSGDGYDTVEACDGGAACALLDQSLPRDSDSAGFDAIVSDVQMPACSGLELLASIGVPPMAPPVVLMTGAEVQEIRDRATRLGAVAVLQKPFELSALREAVRLALDGTNATG